MKTHKQPLSSPGHSAHKAHSAPLNNQHFSVLIVEDDANSRMVLEMAFHAKGFDTHTAVNGNEALAICQLQPPDLIISDILMPEMDGFEFCRQVKLEEQLRDIPFIFYTATFVEELDRELALDLGATQFLVKPMDPMEIIQIATNLLRRESETSRPNNHPTPDPALKEAHLERLNAKLIQKVEELETKQQVLEESMRYNRLLFEQSPVGLVLCDMEGRLLDVNPAYARILGRNIDEVLRLSYWDITPESYREQEQQMLDELKTTGRYGPYEKEYLHKQGHRVPVRLQGLLFEKDGETCIWSSVEDISQRRVIERELENHREHLEELINERTRQLRDAYKELETFSYSVSHDLRTPLRAINGFSQILLEDHQSQFDEQARISLHRIRSASERMGELIEDLLSLSRLSRTQTHWSMVNITGICTDIIQNLQQAEPARIMDIHIEEGMVSNGDAALLRIILENLIGNAWKYTRREAHGRIEVGCYEKDGQSYFFVRDNGIGFNTEEYQKLFQPFQRLESSHDFEGNGIGLATVQRALRRLSGDIHAESEPGKGSTFTFHFRIQPAEDRTRLDEN